MAMATLMMSMAGILPIMITTPLIPTRSAAVTASTPPALSVAVGNNGIGVTGINWDVQVMPLKIFKRVLGIFCSSTSADIVDAIEYATTMGVRVSNNCYGGGTFSQAEYGRDSGIRHVFCCRYGQ